MNTKLKPIALLMISCMLSSVAQADEQPKAPQAYTNTNLPDHLSTPNSTQKKTSFDAKEFADTGRQNPAAIEAGPFYVYPMISVGYGFDDNITRASRNEISSNGVSIAPSLVADLVNNGDRYVIGYNGRIIRYFDQKSNDTESHELQLQAQNTYSSRLTSSFFANVMQAEDQVGATDSRSKTPDQYRQYSVRLAVGYGAADATGRIEGEMGYTDKQYQNNRATTAALDQSAFNAAARFYYRVAPRTRALIEGRYQDINYDLNSATQNSQEYRALTGVTWEADDYFTGSAKVGMLRKSYDDARRGSFSDFTYEAAVRFMPRTYSTFDLTALRTIAESTGVGDHILEDSLSLLWEHAWNNFISTRTGLSYVHSDYVGATRKDNTFNANFNIDYKITRWLKTGAEIRFEDRNSNTFNNDYKRAIYLLSLTGTL